MRLANELRSFGSAYIWLMAGFPTASLAFPTSRAYTMKLLIFSLVPILNGCVSTEIHKDYRDSERISIYKTTCESPYMLTFGCHPEDQEKNLRLLASASIPLSINGAQVRFSYTEDGKAIYLGLSRALDLGFSMTEGYTLGFYDPKRQRLEAAIDGIVAILKQNKAEKIQVIPVTNIWEVSGYYVVSDVSIYNLIKGYAQET